MITKKITTISLFVFWAVVTAVLVSGLVFYQEKQNNNLLISNSPKLADNILLTLAEIAKHNKATDCWMLISGKVYNTTGYFGSHPGGNSTMLVTCGKDATAAYSTKDPKATVAGGSAHSSGALNALRAYYIGDLNQTIGQQKIQQTTDVVPPATREDDDEDDD